MTSAHHHHSKYSLPPPPQNSQNDYLRLPSLKDLNFQYSPQNGGRAPQPEPAPQQQEHSAIPRHVSGWARTQNSPSNPPANSHPHQQHTPPLSAGAHDMSNPKVDYPSKHENGGYVHPGVPLSAQVTPVPGSVNIGTLRNEEAPHSPNQPKRSRTINTNMGVSRGVRQSHVSHQQQASSFPPPQYAAFPPTTQQQQQQPAANQYHQIPSGMPAPPTHHAPPAHAQPALPPSAHEQIHQQPVPVTNHPTYQSYSQYMRPAPVMHHQQHPSNPYPSPGPPPSAPPPQGPWAQQAHAPPPAATQQTHHHQAPPQPPQQQPQHIHPSHLQNNHATQPPPQHAPVSSNPQPPPPPTYMVPQHHMQHHHHQQQQQLQQQQQQQQQHPQQPQQQQPQPQQQQQQQPPPLPPPQQQQPPPPQPQQQVPQHVPPPQQQHQQYQQPPPQHIPFGRTTAIVPTSVDARSTYAPSQLERIPTTRNDTMAEINQHCSILYNFASRYAQMQNTMPHVQPSPQELEEMSQRAQTVVRLLEELQRMNLPEGEQNRDMNAPAAAPTSMQMSPDDPRPPKRPWEDISQDDSAGNTSFEQQQTPQQYAAAENKPQTTAEQDMELIRTKRATSTAGTNGPAGQPKSKYRKRSRATPPGKCHSCNIRETPEWRRGPDGARTLCNACGLHYAKLMRKRDKNANGEAPHIDLETLRASARAADIADKATRSAKPSSSSRPYLQSESASPMDTKQQIPQHHQGSFQLMAPPPPPQEQSSAMTVDSTNDTNSSRNVPPPPPPHAHQSNLALPGVAPPPPWATSTTSASRVYGHAAPDHLQAQSFMRSSQQHSQSR